MPVGQLIGFAAALCNSDERRIAALALRLGLDVEKVRQQPFVKLSGGQKQKILIAIALGRDTRLLIMDEPAANLDPEARKIFFELLADVFTVECLLICHPSHVERRGRNDEFAAVHHHVGIVLQRPVKTDSLPVTSFLGLFHSASLSGFPPCWKPFTCNFGLS